MRTVGKGLTTSLPKVTIQPVQKNIARRFTHEAQEPLTPQVIM